MKPRDVPFLLSVFMSDLLQGLPGEALLREGLTDIQSGRRSIPACLAEIAGPRLRRLGLLPPTHSRPLPEPELRLYRLLRQQGGDAYSRYGALLRELVSFEQALDRRSHGRSSAL
jgi:hypothetical protein